MEEQLADEWLSAERGSSHWDAGVQKYRFCPLHHQPCSGFELTETWCNKKKKHSEPIKYWLAHILRWDLCAYAMGFQQNWFIIHQTSLFHYSWQLFVDDEANQQPITSLGRGEKLHLAEADCLKGPRRDDAEADRPVVRHLDNHPSQAERLCPHVRACVCAMTNVWALHCPQIRPSYKNRSGQASEPCK